MGIAVTTGIPGLAPPASPPSPSAPSPAFPSPLHRLESTPAHRAKHRKWAARGWLGDKGLSIPSLKQAHMYRLQEHKKGCSCAQGSWWALKWQTVVCTTASMLDIREPVAIEEESAEQIPSHSRVNHFYSYLQVTGLCPAQPFRCTAFPFFETIQTARCLFFTKYPHLVTTEDARKDLTVQSSNKRVKTC